MKKTVFTKTAIAVLCILCLLAGCAAQPSETDKPPYSGYLPENSDAYKVFGGLQLWYVVGVGLRSNCTDETAGNKVQLSAMTEQLKQDEEYPYLRFFVPAGTKGEDLYIGVDAAVLHVDIAAYPVLKMVYRTDSSLSRFMTSVETTSQTLSADENTDAALVGDEEWQEAVLDLNALLTEENPSLYAEGDKVIKVLFRLFGDEEVTAKEIYADVKYIGFFPDRDSADGFTEASEERYLKEYEGADVFYEPVTDEIRDQYMSEADQKKEAILSSPNTVDPSGMEQEILYVSSVNGDDANWGLSPEDAVQSLERAQELMNYYGGMVTTLLFERGSIWRGGVPTRFNMTFSAYGEGPKPRFYQSQNAKGGEKWEATEVEHVWKYVGGTFDFDVGNIIFNDGEFWGIKLMVNRNTGMTSESGMVTNGKDIFRCAAREFTGLESITGNLEFYHDVETRELYLRCEWGNPGDYFEDIELPFNRTIAGIDRDEAFVTLDNLCFMYTGGHAVSTFGAVGLTVQNCEFRWIGGSLQGDSGTTRYGNGFQNWGSCTNITVKDCYLYQVYDSAITTQYSGDKPSQVDGFICEGNVIDYANTGFEIFNAGLKENYLNNVQIRNNYIRWMGFHFGHQRPAKNSNFLCCARGCPYTNSVYENNVGIYCAWYAYLAESLGDDMLVLRNNVHIVNAKRALLTRSYGNITAGTGDLYLMPYNERYVKFLVTAGTHQNSKFYYYTDDLFPEEAEGVYYGVHAQPWQKVSQYKS